MATEGNGNRALRIPLEPCDKKNTTQNVKQNTASSKTRRLNFSAGILVNATANDTFKVLCGMTVVFCVFAVIVIRRLWILEMKNEIMQVQLQGYQSTLTQILNQVPIVVVPDRNNEVPNIIVNLVEAGQAQGLDAFPGKDRVRRDAAENNTLPPGKGGDVQKSSDGNLNSKNRFGRRVKNRQGSDRETRAVFMIPMAPNVDINKPELELIGPWYIGDGMDFGFNDLWYRDISLDANRTSVIFKESGLHLIYAQVYYHLSLGVDERPAPMGFRIYIKKNPAKGGLIRRPIPIAECVPSYPSTFYQTCFTQVAWYVEEGDQIYLQHFANSFPMIEADRQGKTFLGIVRLSSAQ